MKKSNKNLDDCPECCYTHSCTAMQKYRYITRYNGKKGTRNTFCGWRLCITRRKETYVRYFTDREYTDSAKALEAAMTTRNAMLAALEQGTDFVTICRLYSKVQKKA